MLKGLYGDSSTVIQPFVAGIESESGRNIEGRREGEIICVRMSVCYMLRKGHPFPSINL